MSAQEFSIDELREMNPDRVFRAGDTTFQRLLALAGEDANAMHPDKVFRVGDATFQRILAAAAKSQSTGAVPGATAEPDPAPAPAIAGGDTGGDAMELVDAPDAPRPPGPFSHAAVIDGWVYTSGMGGLDPATGEVVSDDVVAQSEKALENTEAILRASGCTLRDVVKATVYLTDMADYPRVNAAYEKAFAPHKPARTCVAVSALPVRERMKLDTVARRRR